MLRIVATLKVIAEYLENEILMSNEIEQRYLRIALQYHPKTGLGTAYSVKLTNHGQRPITVTDVFLNLASGGKIAYSELSGQYIQLSTPLPKTLNETEFVEYLFPLYHMNKFKGSKITSPLDVVSITVKDSFEQEYYYPSTEAQALDSFSNLMRIVREHWEKNSWITSNRDPRETN